MAELTVKYELDADGLLVEDLINERDFLAKQLKVPKHLLKVLSCGFGSVVITYWIVRDVLPLAELALCREDVRAELIQRGVKAVYLDSHPSEHRDPVGSMIVHGNCMLVYSMALLLLQCRWTNHCRLYIVRRCRAFLSCIIAMYTPTV